MQELAPLPRRYAVLQFDCEDDIGSVPDNLELLQNFSLRIQKRIDSEKSAALSVPSLSSVHPSQKMNLAVLLSCLSETQERLSERICASLAEVLDFTLNLVDFLRTFDDHNVRAERFISDMQRALDGDAERTRLKFMRDCIETKVRGLIDGFPAPDYQRLTRDALARAVCRLEEGQSYVSGSSVDHFLFHFLERSELGGMVMPTVLGIVEDGVDGTLVTLTLLAEAVARELSPQPTKPMVSVCYCSLVRLLFDEAYVKTSDLCRYVEADGEFLGKCELVAQSAVRSLRFTPGFRAKYGPRMVVAGLFRDKQIASLSKLLHLTNPIDIVAALHRAYVSVVKGFGDAAGWINTEDASLLLLCLVATNPPVNAVSMARFLQKWAPLTLMPEAAPARHAFVSGVEQMYSMGLVAVGGDEDLD
jgi:hypothetical protein